MNPVYFISWHTTNKEYAKSKPHSVLKCIYLGNIHFGAMVFFFESFFFSSCCTAQFFSVQLVATLFFSTKRSFLRHNWSAFRLYFSAHVRGRKNCFHQSWKKKYFPPKNIAHVKSKPNFVVFIYLTHHQQSIWQTSAPSLLQTWW